jgi:hypothetical protein
MDGSALIFLRVIPGSAWALAHMDIWSTHFDSVLSYLGFFLSFLLLASAWRICSHLVFVFDSGFGVVLELNNTLQLSG